MDVLVQPIPPQREGPTAPAVARAAGRVFPASRLVRSFLAAIVLASFAVSGGCARQHIGAVVYLCDGAGWYASAPRLQEAFRRAKVPADIESYSWSTFLGPGTDHLLAARNPAVGQGLARQIEKSRRINPDRPIYLVGLSAGTAVALSALEHLEGDITVDAVALLSPSVSSQRNLGKAMAHVQGGLYATCSRKDMILSGMVVNADGVSGPPAGLNGFVIPRERGRRARVAYGRVYNLPWRSAYVEHDWDGGHVSVTSPRFLANVVIPRLTSPWQHPLDRSVAQMAGVRRSAAAPDYQP